MNRRRKTSRGVQACRDALVVVFGLLIGAAAAADERPNILLIVAEDAIGFELFGNRAQRVGEWKAVRLCASFGPGAWQPFDQKADPGETVDLAAAQPDVRNRLTARSSPLRRPAN